MATHALNAATTPTAVDVVDSRGTQSVRNVHVVRAGEEAGAHVRPGGRGQRGQRLRVRLEPAVSALHGVVHRLVVYEGLGRVVVAEPLPAEAGTDATHRRRHVVSGDATACDRRQRVVGQALERMFGGHAGSLSCRPRAATRPHAAHIFNARPACTAVDTSPTEDAYLSS